MEDKTITKIITFPRKEIKPEIMKAIASLRPGDKFKVQDESYGDCIYTFVSYNANERTMAVTFTSSRTGRELPFGFNTGDLCDAILLEKV